MLAAALDAQQHAEIDRRPTRLGGRTVDARRVARHQGEQIGQSGRRQRLEVGIGHRPLHASGGVVEVGRTARSTTRRLC